MTEQEDKSKTKYTEALEEAAIGLGGALKEEETAESREVPTPQKRESNQRENDENRSPPPDIEEGQDPSREKSSTAGKGVQDVPDTKARKKKSLRLAPAIDPYSQSKAPSPTKGDYVAPFISRHFDPEGNRPETVRHAARRGEATADTAVVPGAVRVRGIHPSPDASESSKEFDSSEMQAEGVDPEIALQPEAIEATLVQPNEDQDAEIQALRDIIQSAPVAEVQQVNPRKRVRILVGFVAIVVILGAIGAGVGVAVSKETHPNRAEAFKNLLYNISRGRLDDPASPQAEALSWIAEEDPAVLVVGIDDEEIIKERYAAAVLYYALGGVEWLEQLDFLTKERICAWNNTSGSGILCDNAGRVNEIKLSNNYLNGYLPEEIFVFSNLVSLEAKTNGIQGSIPSELGLLHALKELDLRENELTGEIPSELGLLHALKELFLHTNELTGEIPKEVSQCQNLLDFRAYYNNLKGNFTALLELLNEELKSLILGQSDFTGTVPASIGRFTGLQHLCCHNCTLDGTLPTEIGTLTAIKFLDFGRNAMVGTIPTELGKCTLMETLCLIHNNLTGTIPTELARLTNLDKLVLYGNSLEGSTDPICNQTFAENLERFEVNVCNEEEDFDCPCCTGCGPSY